ncbi:MAG: hypothetical protein MRJ67_05285 [Nitrospirales bacterium]|nr:hypothetical protein [Nitrospirales bacterium]
MSSTHMELDGLRHILAMMVERAVMKLMLDDTKFMVLTLQPNGLYRESILGFASKNAL